MLNIKKDLAELMAGKEDPMTIRGMMKALGFGNQDRQYLKSILLEMVRQGELVKTGSRYWVPGGKAQARELKRDKTRRKREVVGRLSVTSQGY